MTPDEKMQSLGGELERQIAHSQEKANLTHYASIFLMVLALGCTLSASVLGVFSLASAKVVGGIAGLPAVIAVIAVTLKLEAKTRWSYQKAVKTRTLLRRLKHQGPNPMTDEYVASLSAEFSRLDETMAGQRDLSLNWPGLLPQRSNDRSGTSPGGSRPASPRRAKRQASPPEV